MGAGGSSGHISHISRLRDIAYVAPSQRFLIRLIDTFRDYSAHRIFLSTKMTHIDSRMNFRDEALTKSQYDRQSWGDASHIINTRGIRRILGCSLG